MKNISKVALTSLFSFLSSPVFAQDAPKRLPEIIPILEKVLDYLFPIAGLICLIFIIMGGYMWLISAGDPAKVKQAQGTLTWAILGLVFVLLTVAILEVVINFVSS